MRQASFMVIAMLLISACGESPKIATGGSDNIPGPDARGCDFNAEILRTEHGIPHIKSNNYCGLGYGNGYAFSQDNICTLAEDILTIRGERAEFMGRDGSYRINANGSTADNVDSDFFWRHLLTDERVDTLRQTQDPDLLDAVDGFARGYSRYVRELKTGMHAGRHTACRNEAWLREIDSDDMLRRFIRLAVLASSSVFVESIGSAQPQPPPIPTSSPLKPSVKSATLRDELSFFIDEKPIGSNMYAFSPGQTENGKGMLFGNPHFPWRGTERLWVNHLILDQGPQGDNSDEDFNIFGSSLHGTPAVLIGFNEHFAWSHTVSTAYRFTFYELTLASTDPNFTSYLVDGVPTPMEANNISIQVLEDNGQTSTETRTLYNSRYGPMVNIADGLLEWNMPAGKAFTLRDANLENSRLLEQFLRWNQAKSLDEFIDLHGSVLGVPWVNTVAAGPSGDAYYGDVTVVPNVTDAMAAPGTGTCGGTTNSVVQQLVPGLPVLDGSRTACDWGTDADSPQPGIFGPANLPKLRRADYVHNCNDSYWLTNWREPLTGFNRIIGDEETARSLRTRLCIVHAEERMDGTDGLGGNQWTIDKLQQIVLSSRIHAADLGLKNALMDICNADSLSYDDDANPVTPDATVDITAACDTLRTWDGTTNNDSRGGHIWRQFFRNLSGASEADEWRAGFSASGEDSYLTPNDLNTTGDVVRAAFGSAVQTLSDHGVAMDARMGDLQFDLDALGNPIEIFGGISNTTGAFTVISTDLATPTAAEGYRQVSFGNSYIQTVTWGDDGNPIAEGFITYSQSTDPASPHFSDITERYSDKNWVTFPFTETQIQADLISRTIINE